MEKPSDEMMEKMLDEICIRGDGEIDIDYEKTKDIWRRLFEPEPELPPCPFCGGKAERTPGGGIAGCDRCDLWGPIEWWNRREAGRWTDELVEEYAKHWSCGGGHKDPAEWLHGREGT